MSSRSSRWLTLVLVAGMSAASFHASPEDIDIFSTDEGTNLNAPNVLIVLDNSANWSRQAQDWPGGEQQGQSEVAAIKQVVNELGAGVNVGLMEFITGGAAADQDSGYIRFHIRPMTLGNKGIISGHMDKIYADINAPEEKRPQSNPFGNLMWDVYNYLSGGDHSNGGAGTPANLADVAAYDVQHSNFRSPLTTNDSCTRTIVIFIGNNVSTGPTPDSEINVKALHALATNSVDPPNTAAGDAAVEPIKFADYSIQTGTSETPLGRNPVCHSSAANCTASLDAAACAENGFTSCFCDANDGIACPSVHWAVTGTTTETKVDTVSGPTTTSTPNSDTGEVAQCSKNKPNGACSLPPGTTSQTLVNRNCPNGMASCTNAAGYTSKIDTSWSGGCDWITDSPPQTCGPGGKVLWHPSGTRVEVSTVTLTTTNPVSKDLGETAACYNDAATCDPKDGGVDCSGFDTCECTAPTTNTTDCPGGTTKQFMTKGTAPTISAVQTGTYSAETGGPFTMDEWARFLRQTGVTIPGLTEKHQVTTYTIDVFNKQQHPQFSGLLFNAARMGGGKYFQARDKNSIVNALRTIFTEVQAVNSAFSSASLPINATNRTQNENQVFIGVFKPDRNAKPLWFGNLKRFQIIRSGADIDLGDSRNPPQSAINKQTGFLSDCAVSFWTTDSGNFWDTVISDDPNASTICTTNVAPSGFKTSDYPDGPFVEKGGAAEVVRKGNAPPGALGGDFPINRIIKTISGGTLADLTPATFDDGDPGTDDTAEAPIVRFIRGEDVDNEDNDASSTETRSNIHGDVIHSRPQPVNYGGATGVVIYYGSNDGLFRAVRASDGKELWSFAAPEHFRKFKRLRESATAGSVPISFPSHNVIAGTAPKDYFFDGSTGVFQSFNSNDTIDRAWIFPTMRRGGRKIYAFNVANAASPQYMWSKGCTDAGACDAGFGAIGQTWSIGAVAFIKGYSETRPVVIMGGGYDTGDDGGNTAFPNPATRGRGVYVIDAENGSLVRPMFDFSGTPGARGVAADVALISINPDKFVDYAYAVDTGGNIYRMDFVSDPLTATPLAPGDWKSSRIAFTNGDQRKFLFAPALLQNGDRTVYLAIGSGDREHPLLGDYPYTQVKNRFYVFTDDVSDTDPSTVLDLDDPDPARMADNTTDTDGCDTPKVLPGSDLKGWYMDLTANGQGEQVVSSAVIAGGFVNFSTNRPTPPDPTACTNSLGEARGYFVNLLNASGAIGVEGKCGGARSSEFVGGGLPPSPVIATVQVGNRVETIVIGAVPKEGGEGSAIAPTLRNPVLDSRRRPVYWYKSSGDN